MTWITREVVNRLVSAQMASYLLCSSGMKNLSSIDKVFLCLTAGTVIIAVTCMMLMNS